MKNGLGLKYLLLGLLFSIAIGFIFQESVYHRNMVLDIGAIGKQYSIVLEENSVRDYECVKEKQFILLKPDELIKLSEYMKKNKLVIAPGKYEVNQIYNFEDLKKVFKI